MSVPLRGSAKTRQTGSCTLMGAFGRRPAAAFLHLRSWGSCGCHSHWPPKGENSADICGPAYSHPYSFCLPDSTSWTVRKMQVFENNTRTYYHVLSIYFIKQRINLLASVRGIISLLFVLSPGLDLERLRRKRSLKRK